MRPAVKLSLKPARPPPQDLREGRRRRRLNKGFGTKIAALRVPEDSSGDIKQAGRTIRWRGIVTGETAAFAILFYLAHLSETEEKLFPGFKRIIEWRVRLNNMTESGFRSKKNCQDFRLKAKYYYIMIE